MTQTTKEINNSRKKKASDFLVLMVISLLLVLLVLLWQFINLSTPKVQKVVETTSQTKALWQFTIYNYRDKVEKNLNFPYDSAVTDRGDIYITDTGSGRILKYDRNGKFLSYYDGRREKTLHTPLGISINDRGEIAVADKRMSYVAIFNKNFKLIRKIPEIFPIKPLYHGNKLYVLTYEKVGVYSSSGKLLDTTGSRGKNLNQFDFPNGIAIANNKIYISDSNNHRVKALNEKHFNLEWVEGQPVQSSDDKNRKYDLPAGLASDEEGFLYLVDNFDCSLKLIDKDGRQLAVIGDYGTTEGKFKYPTSITYAGNNRFIIIDRGNNRAQIIDIYPARPGLINASKGARASAIILFGPAISYSGLILGIVLITVFIATFLRIKAHAENAQGN